MHSGHRDTAPTLGVEVECGVTLIGFGFDRLSSSRVLPKALKLLHVPSLITAIKSFHSLQQLLSSHFYICVETQALKANAKCQQAGHARVLLEAASKIESTHTGLKQHLNAVHSASTRPLHGH